MGSLSEREKVSFNKTLNSLKCRLHRYAFLFVLRDNSV